MRVTEKDLSEIMLSLFSEMNLPKGGRVTRGTIDDAWQTTGLRETDIDTALSGLLDEGHIEPASGEAIYGLTDSGHAAMLKSASAWSFLFSSSERLRREAARRVAVPSAPMGDVERRK